MGIFFVYILKSSVCLIVFYLFYRLLLSRETFHRFNRIALLGIFILSLLIPFCEVSTKMPQAAVNWEQLLLMANNVTVSTNAGPSVSWIEIILMVYLSGIAFFFCRNLYSLVKMIRLLKDGEREMLEDGIILITHHQKIAPFSWMKYVVVSASDIEENGREILIHEIAHIKNYHSLDLLLAQFCIFFHWFNPAAWLMKQELQNIHEYEADETVINQGVDAKQYQLLLIKKAVGTRLYSMANSFNHSKLKKRITMMLKEKSNPWARLKYLYILPLAAVTITAFARPEISDQLNEISAVKISDLSSIVEGISKNNASASSDTVASNKGSEEIAIGDILSKKENALTVVKSDSNRMQIRLTSNKHPMVILDGEEVPYEILNNIPPSEIQSLNIIKDKSAIKQFGTRAENGVIQIFMKGNKDAESQKDFKGNTRAGIVKFAINLKSDTTGVSKEAFETMKADRKVNIHITEINKATNDSKKSETVNGIKREKLFIDGFKGDDITIIIDGKLSSDKQLHGINSDDIESINVLKDDKAKEYDKDAKSGVIIVTTKNMK